MLPESIQQTILEHSLFLPTDTVLVAVSGGPDSICLLHALHELGYTVCAAHLNHGIRGKEADEDAAYVQEFCKKLAIPCEIGHRDVPTLRKAWRVSSQQAARKARYEFLAQAADQAKASVIATAHNRDDRIETVLLNILRGTGVEGLRGIPYRRGPFVRPLLDTSRDEIEDYCRQHELAPRRDSSNLSSAYARNNVRSELIPYLERRYNLAVKDVILRLSQIASAESDYMAGLAKEWLAGCVDIPAAELLALPIALQRRVLREWIRHGRSDALANIGQDAVEAIRLAADSPFAITLPGGDWLAQGDAGRLWLSAVAPQETPPSVEMPITSPGSSRFFDRQVDVEGSAEGADMATLCLRNWREGDRMKLPGGTRKLQDIFTDAKVARPLRHTWPILGDKDGPLIVVNLCAAQRAKGLTARAVRVEKTSPEEDR